jgi:hypothetical protein
MGKKKETEDYGAELEKAFARWVYLYEHGGSDPAWPDGTNLNLVHNHVAYYKRKIVETMSPENYPEAFHWPDPPIVDNNYFARADEIRCAAATALERYKRDANLQFLRQRCDFIKKHDRETLRLDALLGRFLSLERAVREDDLQIMRRFRNVENDLADFASCAAKIKGFSPQQMVQAVQISLL